MLLLLAAATAFAQERVEEALHLPVHSVVLPNGLMVIVVEDHRAPIFATAVLYRTGASEDRPGSTGKAHLLEHLMFEGTPAVPSGEFDALLADAGAQNNAWTDQDWTTYQIQGPPEALELALWLEADRMQGALEGLAPEHLENQRAVVLNERLQDEISDDIYPLYVLNRVLWTADHPYAWPVLGTREHLNTVTSEELAGHVAQVISPDNAALSVVGDVDAEDVLALVESLFGSISAGEPPPARAGGTTPVRTAEERYTFVEDLDHPSLYVAWTTVPRGHVDEPALDVLALILSGGQGTRLDDALYYRHQRVTDLQVSTWNGRLGGQFTVQLTRDDRPLAPTLKVIDRELRRLQRRGPSEEEVERAVAVYKASFLTSLEDPEVLADSLHDCQQTFGTPDCLGLDLARYAAVTPADVQRVAQQHLGPGRVLLAVTSPDEQRFGLTLSVQVYPP